MTRNQLLASLVSAILPSLVLTPAAAADKNDENLIEHQGRAVVIEQKSPKSPSQRARKLQEAWVQMSYVVTADGRAIDPIIMNSSGGVDFENELKAVTQHWKFQEFTPGSELPMNLVQSKFTIHGRGKGTTRTFARHAQQIMKALHYEDVEKARKQVDSAVRLGGWNLYESTMLWLMRGRVAGAEENAVEQLEMYQRGLAVSSPKSLPRDARADLLENIFELQDGLGHYSAAMQSFDELEKVKDSDDVVARVSPKAAQIINMLAHQDTVIAKATIANPCDCEGGVALWHYAPQRRTFSFDSLNGNVNSFEARCETQRIRGDVVTGQQWSLPDEWGYCQVFVFGDDGATFDFLSHLQDADDNDAASDTVVATNHVLDHRS